MDNAIAEEMASYRRELADLGFHPQTIRAYSRKLGEFLEHAPGILDASGEESAEAIEAYICTAPTAYDDFALCAGLRKWHWLRFREKLGKPRMGASDFAASPEIDDEVSRFRARLESDGLTGSVVDARCSAVSAFLGWRFPDGKVDVREIRDSDALAYITGVKAHLNPGAAKTEAGRIKRYLQLLSEDDPERGEGLPFVPACWGSSALPRMMGDEELLAIMSVETGPEVGSRNRAALLLMSNMGLRCCEVASLALDDVDFRNGTVRVPATKGCCERKLPLERACGGALAEYIAGHRPESESRAVFLRNKSHRGEPMSKSQIRSSLRYQARLAGIDDFGTHMLRRRAATSMVERGVPMKVVADVLGHAEVQTTKAYLRIDVEGLRSVAADWPGDGRG